MIRGLSFKISQGISNPLFNILAGVDAEKYSWFCVPNQEEVWDTDSNLPFFKKADYNGREFADLIKRDCNIIFLKLQAYISKSEYFNISSYDEFIKSDCQLLLLVYDCIFAEIYCRNTDITKAIYNSIINKRYSDVAFITDSNDNRYKFDIL